MGGFSFSIYYKKAMLLDIVSAIENKLRIQFIYKKEKNLRTLEPNMIGLSKSGFLYVRGNQVSGNNSGLKLFKVSEMTALKITNTPFYSAHPLFKTKDTIITKVIAVVS